MMKCVLKNPCQQLCIELFPSHFPRLHVWWKTRPINKFLPVHVPLPNIWTRFDQSWAHSVLGQERTTPPAICVVTYPSSMLSRSLPARLSAQLFARFPIRPACCLAPSHQSSPQAICTVSYPSIVVPRCLQAEISGVWRTVWPVLIPFDQSFDQSWVYIFRSISAFLFPFPSSFLTYSLKVPDLFTHSSQSLTHSLTYSHTYLPIYLLTHLDSAAFRWQAWNNVY